MSTITIDLQLGDNHCGLVKDFFRHACHNTMSWPEPHMSTPDVDIIDIYKMTRRESAEHERTDVQLDYPGGFFLCFQNSRLLLQWVVMGVISNEWMDGFGRHAEDMRRLLMQIQFPLACD